ncbi:hypothetical protein PFISCL1PPCAC_9406, partial [Pristionchus fissidentatus]
LGVSFTPSTTNCVLLGAAAEATCSIPFEYWKKMDKGCAPGNVTTAYVPDPCLKNAVIHEVHSNLDTSGNICPTMPVRAESNERLYVISAIFP